MRLKKGCVHIYTGEGKGKTSASLGLALRASGRGLKVCMFQFLKGRSGISGEHAAKVKGLEIISLGAPHPIFRCQDLAKRAASSQREKVKKAILEGLERVEGAMSGRRYDIIILDEVINAVSQKFLDEETLLDLVKSRPPHVELVLTGRGATRRLIALADYVTRLEKVKHPWDRGLKARCGIEY